MRGWLCLLWTGPQLIHLILLYKTTCGKHQQGIARPLAQAALSPPSAKAFKPTFYSRQSIQDTGCPARLPPGGPKVLLNLPIPAVGSQAPPGGVGRDEGARGLQALVALHVASVMHCEALGPYLTLYSNSHSSCVGKGAVAE